MSVLPNSFITHKITMLEHFPWDSALYCSIISPGSLCINWQHIRYQNVVSIQKALSGGLGNYPMGIDYTLLSIYL